jgi:hypothetical protein
VKGVEGSPCASGRDSRTVVTDSAKGEAERSRKQNRDDVEVLGWSGSWAVRSVASRRSPPRSSSGDGGLASRVGAPMAELSTQRPRPHNSGMRVAPASWCSTSVQRLPVSPFLHSSDSRWWWIGIGEIPKGAATQVFGDKAAVLVCPLLLLLPLLLPSLLAGAVGFERENPGGGGTGSCSWGWNLKGRSARV